MRLLSRTILPYLFLTGLALAQNGDLPKPPTVAASSTAKSALPEVMAMLNDTTKLNIGDQISFRIVEDRENAVTLTIFDTGEVECPYIGRLQAAGKTCKGLALEAKALLEKDLYYHATVVVAIDTQRKITHAPFHITIVGRVGHPGIQDVPYGERYTVSKAVINAGGFSDFADEKKVKVIRKTGPGDKDKLEIVVNVAAILKDGELEKDVEIINGDMIIVPERLINF